MKPRFVLCVNNDGYPESLEKRKFYEAVDDKNAAQDGLIRIIDESGEDYLYAREMFLDEALPPNIEDALLAA